MRVIADTDDLQQQIGFSSKRLLYREIEKIQLVFLDRIAAALKMKIKC